MQFFFNDSYLMFKNLANLLIDWFIKNKRDLPWRHTTDPYKIWLSEIILQQTRVEQGLPYYNNLVSRYPSIKSLSKAKDDDVMKLWQGLGYYSRARNLLFTARDLNENYKSKFPETFEEIKKLKGIGDYTAAAIASFAFNLKHPVLDGNVYRFITRLYGIETPIDKAETKSSVMTLLNELIAGINDPATFNQALMEFGALHCTPKNPKCPTCPFQVYCIAFKENKTQQIPVKGKGVLVRNRYLSYFVFIAKNKTTYIKKRTEKDIWLNLYDFPLVETVKPMSMNKILKHSQVESWLEKTKITGITAVKPVLHKLSHQNLFVTFLHCAYFKIFGIEKISYI